MASTGGNRQTRHRITLHTAMSEESGAGTKVTFKELELTGNMSFVTSHQPEVFITKQSSSKQHSAHQAHSTHLTRVKTLFFPTPKALMKQTTARRRESVVIRSEIAVNAKADTATAQGPCNNTPKSSTSSRTAQKQA